MPRRRRIFRILAAAVPVALLCLSCDSFFEPEGPEYPVLNIHDSIIVTPPAPVDTTTPTPPAPVDTTTPTPTPPDPPAPPDPPTPPDPTIPAALYTWPELPAQVDQDRNGIDDLNPDYYYSHTFRADAGSVRNFTACYSRGMLHPVWVAAPMHRCYLGSSGRNDSYRDDPQIPFSQSPKFDGYTRGHMIGSSDRTVSVATNKQVFYYSNIGAQLQNGFNTGGGAWNNLEDKVDTYLCSDTLYQVVGCIFQTFTDRYGRTVSAEKGSNSLGQFQKPTGWYKVLLRTKAGNTGKSVANCAASELQCVAFILGHYGNVQHKPSVQDMYSVTALEGLTGLSFFVNVPNAPKDTFNASDWGL